ncbi:hypothetical protein KRX54_06655 [Actinomycetaceae bacterium TAE3-ERU4]|nr:hypothetical protein [Actinomycetaceae bacterium TAE3-ERU4]
MGFEKLIADLEARLISNERLENESLVKELAEAESSRIPLVNRLLASFGKRVSLTLLSGMVVEGVLARIGEDWVQLTGESVSYLVLCESVAAYEGLNRQAQTENALMKSTLKMVLRELCRKRNRLRWMASDNVWNGVILRVGDDWVDFLPEGAREPIVLTKAGLLLLSMVS